MDTEHQSVPSVSRGRPRSTKVHRSILEATLALLAEVGVERLSIEMVAKRAGVGKSSIYRRWSSKEALIVDALEQIKPQLNTSIQGDLHEVLFELARNFIQQMNTPLGKQMLSMLISTLSGNSQISESFWEKHSLPKTKEISSVIENYREKEQLRNDIHIDLVSDLLIGFIMYQLLFKPPSSDLETDLKEGIKVILDGISQSE
ncbi:TetR/AcrR family transcriptional regulator [Cytobacillus purgationiresistens]|uniref:AcrR family transcriptional regulator n=1 Tax=Cytobacillus purgationiresistens TaxID=863449 RepID=A0ABU0AIT2_9BACI|nr:TetR/AcrR family transcriptional regulator [Cytobacillus purgationiresistens]MDQ0271164.1 AcrR family transcriptional regulator [Cytobacillus purgationiresistens]